MKNILKPKGFLFVAGISVLLIGGCGTKGPQWVEFKPDKAGCMVLMPGIPQKVQIKDLELWDYRDEAGHIFSFGYSDTPGPDEPKQLFDNIVKNSPSGYKIDYSKRLTYRGFPVFEYEESNGSGDDIWHRCWLVNNRLYQLSLDGITTTKNTEPAPPPFDLEKTAHRLFGSFELLQQN